MTQDIDRARDAALEAIRTAGSVADLDQVVADHLGKRGALATLKKGLGSLGDTEPEPEEDILEALPGLGDDVEVPTAAGVAVLGQIESLVGDAGVDLGVAE